MKQKDPMLLYEIYIISQLFYLKLDFLKEMRCSYCLFSVAECENCTRVVITQGSVNTGNYASVINSSLLILWNKV